MDRREALGTIVAALIGFAGGCLSMKYRIAASAKDVCRPQVKETTKTPFAEKSKWRTGRRKAAVERTIDWNKVISVSGWDSGLVINDVVSADETTGELVVFGRPAVWSQEGVCVTELARSRLRIERKAWTAKERKARLGTAFLLFKQETTYESMPKAS